MTTVRTLRDKLVNLGLSRENAKSIIGKQRLVDKIEELEGNLISKVMESPLDLDSIDFEEDDKKDSNEVYREGPSPLSESWHEFVMAKFRDYELQEGCPTVEGLRRLTETLIGEIITNKCKVIQAPSKTNPCATVETSIRLIKDTGELHEYSDVADASYINTPPPYNKHLSSTAASRAEGKVLRKLLKLRNTTISYEEKIDNDTMIKDETPEFMNDQQVQMINILSSKLDVNVKTFLNKHFPLESATELVPYSIAQSAIQKLDEFQRDKDSITEEIKGYQSNWREE